MLAFPWADVVRFQFCTETIEGQTIGIRWHLYRKPPGTNKGGWLQLVLHLGPIIPSIWIRTAWADNP